MISRPPDLATLDELIERVRAEPQTDSSATVLQDLQDQRDLLAGPEDATGPVGDILRELESGAIDTTTAAAQLAELSPNPRTPPAAVVLPLEAAHFAGRITEDQYAEVLTRIIATASA